MKMLGTILAAWVAIVGGISVATADPWKDESGHGKWQDRYEDDYERKRERYSYKRGISARQLQDRAQVGRRRIQGRDQVQAGQAARLQLLLGQACWSSNFKLPAANPPSRKALS